MWRLQFLPQRGIFAHFFLSPSGPFGRSFEAKSAESGATAGYLRGPFCNFGLRVEFLCALFYPLLALLALLRAHQHFQGHFHVMCASPTLMCAHQHILGARPALSASVTPFVRTFYPLLALLHHTTATFTCTPAISGPFLTCQVR